VREIANSDLTPGDLPSPYAEWECIGDFALSFNGFKHWGSFEKCAEIANAARHESLDDLRTCLFFEQRRWRHYGDEPDEAAMTYIRDIVEKIRAIVGKADLA
jgi:hypothetical protein